MMPDTEAPRSLLWLVAAGFFMQTLDATIVNTALPVMATNLGQSPLQMQSVVIAYALTMAMVIPASGWFADQVGTRRAYFAAVLLFGIGSALCALSPTLPLLVGARVVQGLGGAMLLPVGRLAVMRSCGPNEFLPVMSVIAVPGLVGPLIGPTLGGWLVQYASWHWIFWINVPIAIAGGAATLRSMPDTRGVQAGRFDLAGYLMIAVGMVAVSLALDGLTELGLAHATVLVLLVFGLAALAGYWLHAAQRAHPLFPPRLFGIPTFGIGLLGNLFARLGGGAMPFLIPLFLQVGLGYTPARAGVTMIPVAAAAIAVKQVVTPLIRGLGYRRVLIANTLLVGLMMASFALLEGSEWWGVRVAQLAVFGAVNSLQFTAMNTVTLKDLSPQFASAGNSLLSMVQMLSMSLGVAAAGGLLGAFSHALSPARGPVPVFHATFVCIGLMTAASAWIFAQLGRGLVQAPEPRESIDLG
jgi:EmrB/QacA subfamily drug resistance transporter